MRRHSRGTTDGPCAAIRSAPTLLAAVLAVTWWACAPEGDTPGADGEQAAASERDRGAAQGQATARGAQEAPACRFTASGEELTGRASPPDSATATLGGQTVKLCYGAPSVRGREVMGGLVPYGEPWRMGANEPTTLHLPFAAQVGTVRVEPGAYALYAVPGEPEWTIVLNSDPERWGIPIDESVRANDVGSFTARAERLDSPAERLTIQMERSGEGAANVVLEWERTRVRFPLRRVEG